MSFNTGVGGVVTGPLPAEQSAHSFGFETETVLPLIGLSAVEAIATSSTRTMLPPDAIEFELVQVTFGTEPVQAQPADEVKFTV